MRILIQAVAAVALCAASAHAADYRAEIDRYVVDPCYMELARRMGAPPSNRALILTLAKQQNTYEIERMIEAVMPAVHGKAWRIRREVYEFARRRCIGGGRR